VDDGRVDVRVGGDVEGPEAFVADDRGGLDAPFGPAAAAAVTRP